MEQSMLVSVIRRKQKATAFLSLGLIASCALVILFSIDAFSASAMRSRVYGFRNTDNKEAMQLVGKLGFKVTIDAHSSSVVVLTGDDADELTRAYTLMEVADQKEPVVLKVLGLIPDDKAASVIDEMNTQLKTLNIGTLLNPPAKAVAEPLVVDVYQGELIAIAAESQIAKIEKVYQSLQKQKKPSQPAVSEPNVSTPAPVVLTVPAEPNVIKTPVVAVEPNHPVILPKPAPEPVKFVVAEPNKVTEPNKPVLTEILVIQPAEVAVKPQMGEPNVVKPQESQTQDDFMSEELLKTLDAEEKKAEVKKAEAKNAAVTSAQPVKAAQASEPAKEITSDEFKKIVAQLMKQTAEEEKKASAQPAAVTDANQPAVSKPAQQPVPQPEASKPVPAKIEPAVQKVEKPKADSRAKTVKTSSDPNAKAKTTDAKPLVSKAEEELELTMTVPEKVEIKQLIELVGKQLGLNYMYDETKIRGEVTLKVYDGKIKVKDVYTLLETVLRYKGFVMTRRGNLVTILPNAELTFTDPKFHTPGEPIEAGDVYINSIFTFKYARYTNVQNILRSLNLGISVVPIPESNTLIITDYAYRIDKIEQVIAILDVPGTPKTYTYRSLQYMQASELIPRLQSLASQLENISITAGTTAAPAGPAGMPIRTNPQTGQPMPGGMPQPAMAQSAAPQEQTVYLDADQRTNRVLMIGNEVQLKTVNKLIDSLDVKQYNLRYVKEYEIKNVDASEVINVLNELGLATVATTAGTTQPTRQPGQPVRPGQQPVRPGIPQQPQQAAVSGQASTTMDQPSISIRPNTNSLLVNATGEQHEDIALVIKHIDVEQKDQRTIEEYEIQNVDAKEVVQTLGDLSIISKDSVSNITSSKSSMYESQASSRSGRSGRNSQSPFPQSGVPGGEGVPEPSAMVSLPLAEGGTVRELITTEPQISILETTNSLLIYATPRQHASVALVIAHVDRELSATTAPYVVYPLENQAPEELADTLSSLIDGTAKRATTSGTTGKTQPGMAPSPMDNRIRTEDTTSNLPKKDEERITIIPDKKSNALVVYANKKNQQWIATLIKALDMYRPQVLLDCTLVKIKQDESFTYDLDIIGKTYGGATMRGDTIVGNQADFVKDPFIDARSTSGTGKVFFNSDRVQALLDVVETKGYGRIMSRPKILVNDNEEGSITTKNTIAIPEVKVITTPYSTGTDTTSASTSNNVEFKDYDAGVELKIKPHISKGEMLRLEITLSKTLFTLKSPVTIIVDGKTNSYPSPPDRTSTDVVSVATVPDGSTIVLGGLEEIDQQKNSTKVPILGDLPLVGGLFRSIDNQGLQDKLYVFVKANVIRPSDQVGGLRDIKRVSDKYRNSYEDMEQQFQKMESWPGIKANPMQPKGVLEEDDDKKFIRNSPESEQPSVPEKTD
jgi:type II secretory pathway component GspD/PulD (secretin)